MSYRRRRVVHRRRRMHGDGIRDWFIKVNDKLKEWKPATKIGQALDAVGLRGRIASNPYGAAALAGLDFAKSQGYGRRRRVVHRRAYGGSKTRRRVHHRRGGAIII